MVEDEFEKRESFFFFLSFRKTAEMKEKKRRREKKRGETLSYVLDEVAVLDHLLELGLALVLPVSGGLFFFCLFLEREKRERQERERKKGEES